MTDSAVEEHLGGLVRTLQIIVGAMAVGVIAFLSVGSVVPPDMLPFSTDPSSRVLTTLALVWGGMTLVAHVAAPKVMERKGVARIARGEDPVAGSSPSNSTLPPEIAATDAGKLCTLFATLTIVRSAMIEGAALLAGLAFVTEKQITALCAALALIAILLAWFPTRNRISAWIEQQLQVIEQTKTISE